MTENLYSELSPVLPSRIWAELDIVPMVFRVGMTFAPDRYDQRVDEQADSMARKCIM